MLLTDLAWPVVCKIILDGRIAPYLADLLNKALRLYKKWRRVLLTMTVNEIHAALACCVHRTALEKVNCKIFNLEEHCINQHVEWLWNFGHDVDTDDLHCCHCQTSLCPPPIQIAILSMSYLKGGPCRRFFAKSS